MISYIRLYGPPVYEAIKELEKIAIDMPEVYIMDTILASSLNNFSVERGIGSVDGDRVIGDYFVDYLYSPSSMVLNSVSELICIGRKVGLFSL